MKHPQVDRLEKTVKLLLSLELTYYHFLWSFW